MPDFNAFEIKWKSGLRARLGLSIYDTFFLIDFAEILIN